VQIISHALNLIDCEIESVSQKLLTRPYFCNTLIIIGSPNMANVLSIDKQIAVIAALAEGSGMRQIERMTGVHPDTINHAERLNGTTRLYMHRLTRLTYAFSKKRENFEAAVALHFAYYNFVKRHITLRATPAMAAGIERDFWTVGNLIEAAA
jgi:hypothetical protein